MVKIEVFDSEGKSVAKYEYRDIDLIEIRGSIKIDYSTFSFPKNLMCISIESQNNIKVIGRVLKIG